MKLTIKKENYEIKDLNDWQEYAGPVDPIKQWVDKRSAKEFARYMLSNKGKIPFEVEKELKDITKSKEFILYPEFLTGFAKYNMGSRGPRHHDGLLIGKDIVVGIEAKADEALDNKYLSEYDATKNRYKNISKHIFGDLPNKHKDIRYQLVSATMGTLIEAYERGVKNAVLLIISFISNEKTKKENIDRNIKDMESFKKALKHVSGDRYSTPFSNKHKINYYFKCIEINLDKVKY